VKPRLRVGCAVGITAAPVQFALAGDLFLVEDDHLSAQPKIGGSSIAIERLGGVAMSAPPGAPAPGCGMPMGGPMGMPGMPGMAGAMMPLGQSQPGGTGASGSTAPACCGGCPSMPSMPGMGAMPSMGAMPGMPGMGMMPGMMPGMNPMMMMAMMQQMAAKMGGAMPTAAAAGGAAASAASEKRKEAEPALGLLDDDIDPQVQELCDYFNIEDRWVKRLNETMRKRQETKQEDIDKLYEVLERARSPTGLLTVKIGEMELLGETLGRSHFICGWVKLGDIRDISKTRYLLFSQKHLRCLGSRLVALAAGERD
ncbi:unnamed protein product, partial [Cladocopium goreaui]